MLSNELQNLRQGILDRLYADCDCAYALDKIDTTNWVGSCDKCVFYFKTLQRIDKMIDRENKTIKI